MEKEKKKTPPPTTHVAAVNTEGFKKEEGRRRAMGKIEDLWHWEAEEIKQRPANAAAMSAKCLKGEI